MNERIQKLIEQAELVSKQQNDGDGWRWGFMAQDLKNILYENLAELIVRECMSVADLPKNPTGQWDHLEASEVIARHFGVES